MSDTPRWHRSSISQNPSHETQSSPHSTASPFSTGERSPLDASDTEPYTPPYHSALLPDGRAETVSMEVLIGFLASIRDSSAQEASTQDYENWRHFITNDDSKNCLKFSHEDYSLALLHASEMIMKASDSTGAAIEGGMKTGMPLKTVKWADITADMVSRMNTMAIKSGILYACGALKEMAPRSVALRNADELELEMSSSAEDADSCSMDLGDD